VLWRHAEHWIESMVKCKPTDIRHRESMVKYKPTGIPHTESMMNCKPTDIHHREHDELQVY
jgi:hypothetical protein